MNPVARALKRVSWGLALILGALALPAVTFLTVQFGSSPGQFPLATVWLALGLQALGQVLCLCAPPEARARRFVAAALGVTCLGLLILPWQIVLLASTGEDPSAPEAQAVIDKLLTSLVVAVLCALLAVIPFLVSLRRLAQYLQERELAREALKVLVLWVGWPLVLAASGWAGATLGEAGQKWVGMPGVIAAGMAAMIAIVMYGSLLYNLRTAIHNFSTYNLSSKK